MDGTHYAEDGDPYGPTAPQRPSRVRPWVWGLLGVGLLGGLGYAVTVARATLSKQQAVPILEEKNTVTIPTPPWHGYAAAPVRPAPEAPRLERDPRVDDLERRVTALQETHAAEVARLEEQLAQRERDRDGSADTPTEEHKAPAAASPTQPAPPKRHKTMTYMAFTLPESTGKPPVYRLAPGDTKIPCTVESKQNSDVESVGTVKITANIWDTDTRRQLLIPQGSTLTVRYHSANLRYGNQRLPEYTTVLTLPQGTSIELDREPVMDALGQAGLVTRVDNHFWRAVPAVLIQGVLQGSQASISSTTPMVAGVAGSAAQFGQRMTQPFIDMRPTIEVDPGEECLVILTRELQLAAYRERR